MAEMLPIILSVLGVFLVMGIGGAARYAGWLTTEADRTLAKLVAGVMLPCYFLDNILYSDDIAAISESWLPPLIGFVWTSFTFAIAYTLARKFGPVFGLTSSTSQRTFGIGVGICNYGYIPYPLTQQFYAESMIDLILHNAGVDLALWSVGVLIISGGATMGGDRSKPSWQAAILSPPFIAAIVALVVRAAGYQDFLPVPFQKAISSLAVCAIPLGLLLSGAMLMEFSKQFSPKKGWRVIFAAVALRQVLFPAGLLLLGSTMIADPSLRRVLVMEAAMPAAIFPIVLVRLYGGDTQISIQVILSTSLLGILAIPIWLTLGQWWLFG
ncbi:MAG: AEC family transporter [Planctomycetota bacterium]